MGTSPTDETSMIGAMRPKTLRSSLAVVVSLVAAILLGGPISKAAADPFVGIGLGPAIRIDDWPYQVRVEQSIGYSFDGHGGFYLSFAPSQSWGNDFWTLVFPLGLGYDFQLLRNRDLTLQLGPGGTVGFALSDDFNSGRDVDPWFHLSVHFGLRLLVLQERLAIYLRPVGLEFAFGDDRPPFYGVDARYFLVGGIQYYF